LASRPPHFFLQSPFSTFPIAAFPDFIGHPLPVVDRSLESQKFFSWEIEYPDFGDLLLPISPNPVVHPQPPFPGGG